MTRFYHTLKHLTEEQKIQHRRKQARERYHAENPSARTNLRLSHLTEEEKQSLITTRRKNKYENNKEEILLKCKVQTKAKVEAKAGRKRPERCEVCGCKNQYRKALCFDHDHITGKFRGWLCGFCNIILGKVHDNPALLRKLAAYLERPQDV